MEYLIIIVAPFLAFVLLMLLSLAIKNIWLDLSLLTALFAVCMILPEDTPFLPLASHISVWALVIATYFLAHCYNRDVRALSGPAPGCSFRAMLKDQYTVFGRWAAGKFGLAKNK